MSEETKKATKKKTTKAQAAPAPEPQATPEDTQTTPEPQAAPEGLVVGRILKVTKPLMRGDDVQALQAALIAHDYHCGPDSTTGIFGRHTAHAVRCFQAHKRLIVDGKAGKYTITALGGTWQE